MRYIFIGEHGDVTQSDDENVMSQQAENDTTCIIDTQTGTYWYGGENKANTPMPIENQTFYSEGDAEPKDL
jgi:hypothetical protein